MLTLRSAFRYTRILRLLEKSKQLDESHTPTICGAYWTAKTNKVGVVDNILIVVQCVQLIFRLQGSPGIVGQIRLQICYQTGANWNRSTLSILRINQLRLA